MSVITKDLGAVTAYAAAVNRGYTGTKEEFETLMASYATVAQQAAESAQSASSSAQGASQAATSANTAMNNARTAESNAQSAASGAQGYAQSAQQSAQSASQSATDAESAKNTAVNAVDGFAAGAQQALDGVNQAGNNWKSLAERQAENSEAYALGTRDGEDVGSSDPSYHNNAKYYAEFAGTSAQTASDAAQTATAKAGEAAQSASAAAESARTLTIDRTLTQAGQAADAKETGDKINAVDVVVNGVIAKNYTEGKNITASGAIADDPNACISDFIPVANGDILTFYYTDDTNDTTSYRLNIYDADKNFVDFVIRNPVPAIMRKNITADGQYVRFSFKKGFAGRLDANASPSVYLATDTVESAGVVHNVGNLTELETAEKSSIVGAVNEVKGSIPAFPVEPKDTTFFHISKNMIDPSALVSGELVNQTNGTFKVNSGYTRTGYIEVEPNATYVVKRQVEAVSANFRYAFYDASKTYISGSVGSISDMLLTSPANAKYIAMSEYNGYVVMLALYDGDKSFEPYGNEYILNEYIKPDMEDVLLTIPSKIYALVGYELNIYFENITEEWEKYKWDVICSKGMQLERGYRITPVAGDVGTYTLTIKASISDTISKEVTTTLVVTSASAGASVTKSVIVLGDSTTNNGIAITKLNENFSTDAMNISTLGTRGTAPNNHEGRSGWKLNDYFTVEYIDYTDGRGHVVNPFYNPTTQTFDAGYYFANSGIAKPDWFFINMGINDVFGYETGAVLDSAIETCIGYVDSIIASVKSTSPSSKIGVCLTIPPNHSQDAFGKAYSNGQTRYRYKKNNTTWVNRLIAEYDNRESEGIYLIPIHTNLDTVYNMGMETLPVNARNTTATYQSPISNGGVHPVESGYWQIADVYTAFLKAHAED